MDPITYDVALIIQSAAVELALDSANNCINIVADMSAACVDGNCVAVRRELLFRRCTDTQAFVRRAWHAALLKQGGLRIRGRKTVGVVEGGEDNRVVVGLDGESLAGET